MNDFTCAERCCNLLRLVEQGDEDEIETLNAYDHAIIATREITNLTKLNTVLISRPVPDVSAPITAARMVLFDDYSMIILLIDSANAGWRLTYGLKDFPDTKTFLRFAMYLYSLSMNKDEYKVMVSDLASRLVEEGHEEGVSLLLDSAGELKS